VAAGDGGRDAVADKIGEPLTGGVEAESDRSPGTRQEGQDGCGGDSGGN